MGLFGKLFGGGGPRKPPAWAKDWDDGARFDRWCDAVSAVLADAGLEIPPHDVRTGSLMLTPRGGGREYEWIFHDLAAACAKADEDAWPSMIGKSFRGEASDAEVPDLDDEGAPEKKAWVMGTTAWGGVILECGASEMVLVVLPIRERAPLAELPEFPAGLIGAIVVCNGAEHGVLDVPAVAAAAGLERVYAIDAGKPLGVPADPLPAALRRGPLTLGSHGGCVVATWDDGANALVGDVIPTSLLFELAPQHALGMILVDELDPKRMFDLEGKVKAYLFANAPRGDARAMQQLLGTMGIDAMIANAELTEPRRLRVIAHMALGELDQADALAKATIEQGEDVDDLTYQRAMIALMRGDEDAALALLDELDTAQAHNSRAAIFAHKKDPRAIDEARAALDALPGDAIAIRGAVAAHALTGDASGARSILEKHGAALDPIVKADLARAIDDPTLIDFEHRFPEHAALVLEAVKPMLDAKRFADAEVALRRAAAWDPDNAGIVEARARLTRAAD
ncbi:MAG TPA: hypothetical protein VL463_16500 [Kofleriaceae bacterium]|nr:hypothetical protein [Kofleriaceae bacterium]